MLIPGKRGKLFASPPCHTSRQTWPQDRPANEAPLAWAAKRGRNAGNWTSIPQKTTAPQALLFSSILILSSPDEGTWKKAFNA